MSQLAAALESRGDVLFAAGPDGGIIEWNPAAKRLYGYSSREAHRLPVLALFYRAQSPETRELWHRARQGEVFNGLSTHLHKDGSRMEVSLTLWPLVDEAGHPAGVCFLVRDTTASQRDQRHQLEQIEQLREAAERVKVVERRLREHQSAMHEAGELEALLARYRDLFETAPDAYLVTDAEAHVKEANRAAGVLLGSPPNRLVGLPLAALFDGTDRRTLRNKLSDLRRHQHVERWHARLRPHTRPPLDADIVLTLARDPAGGPSMLRWCIRDASPHTHGRVDPGEKDAPAACELDLAREELARLRLELVAVRAERDRLASHHSNT